MRITIEFDKAMYEDLKLEAARRGLTVRELVVEGVRHLLGSSSAENSRSREEGQGSPRPTWDGALAEYARAVGEHSMEVVRNSIVRERKRESGA